MNSLFRLYFISLFLPAFSVLFLLIGLNVQNRIMWLPLGIIFFLIYKHCTCSKVDLPILFLCSFFFIYCFVAVEHSWNVPMYVGYFLTFLLLFVTNIVIRDCRDGFLLFFKRFLLVNFAYVIFQLICLNLGFDELAMIHSNLPAQKAAEYTIPIFLVKPFYRYTGLFNESSPFAFYLSISFCFFGVFEECKRYKYLSLFLLLFSGAKFACLFLLLHAFFFIKSKVVKLFALLTLISISLLFIYYADDLILMTNGEVASIFARFNSFGNYSSDINYWGLGLQESSEGKVSLDFFSILTSGFGYCGLVFIFICLFSFYHLIQNRDKNYFCIPFFCGLMSSGSFLILQYSLLSYCLMYLHNNPINNTIEYE